MAFSYSAVWDSTLGLLRSNGSLLLAIAGVFLFLPGLLTAYFIPPPEQAENFGEMMVQLSGYVRETWHWALLANIANMVGALSIYLLLLRPEGRTVGGIIAGSLTYLPSYFLLSILVAIVVGLGLVLLIAPGIYLVGRLAVAGAVMVAEHRLNPLAAFGGSFERTRGRGWAVAGLIVLVAIGGTILILAVETVLGSVFLLLGGREGLGKLLVAILESGLNAAFSVVLFALLAATYRELVGEDPTKVFA